MKGAKARRGRGFASCPFPPSVETAGKRETAAVGGPQSFIEIADISDYYYIFVCSTYLLTKEERSSV